jgi:hypothetical protein
MLQCIAGDVASPRQTARANRRPVRAPLCAARAGAYNLCINAVKLERPPMTRFHNSHLPAAPARVRAWSGSDSLTMCRADALPRGIVVPH